MPPLAEMRRADHGDPADLAPVQQLARDQSGLDRLSDTDVVVIYLPLEPVAPRGATFPPPDPDRTGAQAAALLPRDALRMKLRAGAGPFRSFGNIAVEPRAYQLVPLMMALKMGTVRLLIGERSSASGQRLCRFENRPWSEAQPSILFSLEPSDHVEESDLRAPISKQVDRVPVVSDATRGTITWITQSMLDDWNISFAELETTASHNLAAALARAKVTHEDLDGVRLGIIETGLTCKASLILAPNLGEVVSPTLGLPLLAVIPDRDFLYLWAAQHRDFVHRLGGVVVREFTKSPYPLTTEVFEIGDAGIVAIGAFPVVET